MDPTAPFAPEYTLRSRPAGFVTRLAAFVIDVVIISATTALVGTLAVLLLQWVGIDPRNCAIDNSGFPLRTLICRVVQAGGPLAGLIFTAGYPLIFWWLVGKTPGKAILGIQIVQVDDDPINLLNALRRLGGYGLGFATLGVGFLWILLDPQRRGWHDRLAGTKVIYMWDARHHRSFYARIRHLKHLHEEES